MKLKDRWNSESPRLFKNIIKIGLSVGAVGIGILASPVTLPIGIVTLGGYLATTGVIASAVAKLTVQK
jgi:hypothetical protein